MLNILNMDKKQLLEVEPRYINKRLAATEILHVFRTLGGFWNYDYEAAYNRRAGYHALLKSGKHSDGFLNSHTVLQHDNWCMILAQQMVWMWESLKLNTPTQIVGVPTGATKLGLNMAFLMGTRGVKMEKERGKIQTLGKSIYPSVSTLLVEDFCTNGTGFTEAISLLKDSISLLYLLPYAPVIINRGGKRTIETEEGDFQIFPLADFKIEDWEEDECPLCQTYGSLPIKPKESEENWEILTHSQN